MSMFENGLTWVKADFHLHTHKDKEFKYSGEENSFVKEYIAQLKSESVSVGVITNHNKFDEGEYKALKKSGRKEGILILPGVELSVKEANGIHTLIVFNPDEWIVNGENFIAHFLIEAFAGISNSENRNTRCKFDLRDVIEALDSYGKDYFIVFAHVDQGSGLMQECSGGLLESLSQINKFKSRVLALQKVRKPETMSTFQRCLGYSCAQVEGSDPKSISNVGHCDRATYLKIGDLSYDSVKFALTDFQNRVLGFMPQLKHGVIESISFTGGKLDGETIYVSPALNTLIGIRGSGKSSILEVLRYAFNIQPESDKEYKEGLVKSVLGSGGQITVRVCDKFGKKYEIRRIYGERPNVLDENGNDLGISIDQILKNILYFGQKDLSQSSSYELQLLDHLVGNKIGNFSQELEGFHAEIEDAIKQLLDVEAIPTEIEDLNTQKSNCEHHLRIFEERGVADKLKKQTGYGLDRQKINDVKSDISRDITAIKTMIAGIVTRNDALNGYTSEYNAELIEEVISVLESISTQIDSIKSSLVKLESLRDDLASILTKLDDKMELLKGEFAEIKRQIGDTELDVDAYPQLKANLESVKTKIEDLFKKMGSQETIKNNLRASMRKRNELLACEFSAYESEVKAINESQPELSVELTFKGDKDAFRELLKNAFRGSNLKDAKRQMLSENFTDFLALVDDIILDDGKKCKAILSENEFGKVKEKILSQYGELIRKLTPNKVEIKYHGKLLKQHSLGQRASALVLFILTKSENDVIIIDQPEDDLDNKVIYDEVIKAIRDKKTDIQFIFATHNANIPVLGDAEKIVAAEYSEGKIIPIQGNIDSPATHKLIVDIMEGGQEAFERRQMIYTAWN